MVNDHQWVCRRIINGHDVIHLVSEFDTHSSSLWRLNQQERSLLVQGAPCSHILRESIDFEVKTSIPTSTNVIMLPQFDGPPNSLGPMVGTQPHPLGVVTKKRSNGHRDLRL